jgi:hypothetical protein
MSGITSKIPTRPYLYIKSKFSRCIKFVRTCQNKKSNYFDFICGKIIRNSFFQIYGKYTGIETGYGFFGFNVRSTGFVINEYCGKTSNPEFNSLEAENRYGSLRSLYIDYLKYQFPENRKANQVDGMFEDYLDLVLKNVSAFSMRGKVVDCDSVLTGYYILELPKLVDLKNDAEINYELLPVKKFVYAIDK